MKVDALVNPTRREPPFYSCASACAHQMCRGTGHPLLACGVGGAHGEIGGVVRGRGLGRMIDCEHMHTTREGGMEAVIDRQYVEMRSPPFELGEAPH